MNARTKTKTKIKLGGKSAEKRQRKAPLMKRHVICWETATLNSTVTLVSALTLLLLLLGIIVVVVNALRRTHTIFAAKQVTKARTLQHSMNHFKLLGSVRFSFLYVLLIFFFVPFLLFLFSAVSFRATRCSRVLVVPEVPTSRYLMHNHTRIYLSSQSYDGIHDIHKVNEKK